MFEGECDLTYEEESQIEQPANIYSMIRTLEFIEWAYNFSHINKDTYIEQTNILLEQYNTSAAAYDKFPGIDNFCQKYGLTDCKYAINRIKQGNVRKDDSRNAFGNIFELTQKFNDLVNFLYLQEGAEGKTILVSDIFQFINELVNTLHQCKNLISLDDQNIKKVLEWGDKIRNRKAAESIPFEEQKQILFDVNLAYEYVTKELHKK